MLTLNDLGLPKELLTYAHKNKDRALEQINKLKEIGQPMFVVRNAEKPYQLFHYSDPSHPAPVIGFTNAPVTLPEVDAKRMVHCALAEYNIELEIVPAIEWYETFLKECESTIELF